MVDTVDAAAPQIADPANEGGPPRTMRSSAGPVARFGVGFGEDGAPRAEFALAGGQSGDPQSPHFTDLLQDWLRDRYRPFPFARSEVEGAQAERRVYPAGFPRIR
jgi:acyl-homoserine lactone acylase PvdQ